MTTDLQFYDDARPPLVAGDYLLTVAQQVVLPPPDTSPPDYVHRQALRVSGPRLGLGPDDVVSVYPPPGSLADQHATLAHAVLARPTLPWEIALDPSSPAAGASATRPAAGDGPVAPWLALLVLRPEEIVRPTAGDGNLAGTRVVPLTDYLEPEAGTLGPAFTEEQIARLVEEYPDHRCTVVDVGGATFGAIAPRSTELPYLAHVRQVSTVDQETDGAVGWFGVVVGNRLPTASRTGLYVAHLVSLEGFAERLPDRRPPSADATVRLLSLHSWTFRSYDSADSFDALVKNVDIGVLRLPGSRGPDRRAEPARPGVPDPRALVGRALDGGYTASPYLTRFGEQTTAWYRGPCLPVRTARNRQPSFPAAEAALVYDPETGMFDVSFAVAWQVGRLLTLGNRDVAVALLTWLRSLEATSHRLADRLELVRRQPSTDRSRDVDALLAPGSARRTALGILADTVAPAILGDDTRRPACGPALDRTGLLDDGHRLPGLLRPAELAVLLGGHGARATRALPTRPAAPEAMVLDLVRSVPPGPCGPRSVPRPPRRARPSVATAGSPLVGDPGDAEAGHRWRPRGQRARRVLENPTARAVVLDQGPPLPEAVARWLAQLSLLQGVPFNHLVPDTRMLPPESMRFFFVDQNWLDALLDGALSIGAVTDRDAVTLSAAREHVLHHARRRVATERERRRRQHQRLGARGAVPAGDRADPLTTAPAGGDVPGSDRPDAVWTGFVLRSSLVSGWPGLRVSATTGWPAREPLALLRLDRLSPDVLIAIVDGVAGRVELATPAQTLHFGAVDDEGTLVVHLRGLGGADRLQVGQDITGAPPVPVPRRDTPADCWIVDVENLVKVLAAGLSKAYGPLVPPTLGPGALGVQLVAASERQAFVAPKPATSGRGRRPQTPRPGPVAPAPIDVQTLLRSLDREQ